MKATLRGFLQELGLAQGINLCQLPAFAIWASFAFAVCGCVKLGWMGELAKVAAFGASE